jgi:2-desacetyl-2-hydroxyethyl bacteriochlorophyllide A dehydrogenase
MGAVELALRTAEDTSVGIVQLIKEKKMKAARLKGARDVVLEEIPIPDISDTEVLIEVKYCGICGADLHAYRVAGFFPLGSYMGHEFSGVVAKVGNKVEGWKPGDRVVIFPGPQCGKCWACKHGFWSCCEHAMEAIGVFTTETMPGAFAKFVRVPVPEKRLYPIPKELSFEAGALVEPLATSLHAVRISAFRPGDQTMVLGAGMIGLGVIAFLKNAGAGLIIVTEVIEKRKEVAKKLGADYVFSPQKVSNLKEEVLKLTNGLGVAQVFDCSGISRAFQSATEFVRPRGQIMLVGVITTEVSIIPININLHEIQLQGSWCYYPDEFPIVINFLKRGALPIKEIITSKTKLSDIVEQGFNKLLTPGHAEIKILVSPD